jgi:hypothetical protein
LPLFAALVSLGTALLICGVFSVVFLPGSPIPSVVMASGGLLLATAFAMPIWVAVRQRGPLIRTVIDPLRRPEQITRALERLRSLSPSEVADRTVSGTLIAVFLLGLLATGFFGFSNSAIGISQLEMRSDVAVSLLALGAGLLWGWLAPISRLAGARQGAAPETPEIGVVTAVIGPLGLNGAPPSPRPLWLLLRREVGDLISLLVVLICGGVFAFLAAYQLGISVRDAAIGIVGIALVLLVAATTARVRTLRRLCATGVEIEANIDDVSTAGSGENRRYVAQYHYFFAGRSFPLRISGMLHRSVTRFGERPVVLVDPADPNSAVIFRGS